MIMATQIRAAQLPIPLPGNCRVGLEHEFFGTAQSLSEKLSGNLATVSHNPPAFERRQAWALRTPEWKIPATFQSEKSCPLCIVASLREYAGLPDRAAPECRASRGSFPRCSASGRRERR